jgi:hypothetical protein
MAPCLLVTLTLGCVSTNNLYSSLVDRKAGMNGVDKLLTYIEHVYIDTEVAQERAGTALDALHELVSRDFSGDPLVAYSHYVQAIDSCEQQSVALGRNVEGMKLTADIVFTAWAEDLGNYSSTEMRLRSHERMDRAKMAYRDIVLEIEPGHALLTEYCAGLRDHAFFLSHDFNAAAIASIEPDLRRLGLQASDLAKKLHAGLEAAENYMHMASLPGTVGLQPEVEDEPVVKTGGTPPLR